MQQRLSQIGTEKTGQKPHKSPRLSYAARRAQHTQQGPCPPNRTSCAVLRAWALLLNTAPPPANFPTSGKGPKSMPRANPETFARSRTRAPQAQPRRGRGLRPRPHPRRLTHPSQAHASAQPRAAGPGPAARSIAHARQVGAFSRATRPQQRLTHSARYHHPRHSLIETHRQPWPPSHLN